MIVCPSCGKDNEDFFMFCLGCGSDLTAAQAASSAAAPDDPAEPPDAAEPKLAPRAPAAPRLGGTVPFQHSAATSTTDWIDQSSLGQPEIVPTLDYDPDVRTVVQKPAQLAVDDGAGVVIETADEGVESPARIVLINEDGSDGEGFTLTRATTVIGREGADIDFGDDDFLAGRHAVLFYESGRLFVQPLATTNGVYKRILDQSELESGDAFRIGQELLRFELVRDMVGPVERDADGTIGLASPLPPDTWGRLAQLVSLEDVGSAFLLSGDEIFLGRERGDITFPEDGYVSGSHAVIVRRGGRFFLKDLGSSNGTYVRLKAKAGLDDGDLILAGQQLFRIEA